MIWKQLHLAVDVLKVIECFCISYSWLNIYTSWNNNKKIPNLYCWMGGIGRNRWEISFWFIKYLYQQLQRSRTLSFSAHTLMPPCCHSNAHCGCRHSAWWQPLLCLPCTLYTDSLESQVGSLSKTPCCTLRAHRVANKGRKEMQHGILRCKAEWLRQNSTLVRVTGGAVVMFQA